MTYKFFGKEVSGPFTIPSGILTTNTRTMKRIAQDVPQVGIITTKSIGPEPRPGNREPIVHCLDEGRSGNFVNAVGLRNLGADAFAEELAELEDQLPDGRFLLASVFGSTPDEMCYVTERFDRYVNGHELNYSCPHSPGHGTTQGHDPDSVYKFTKAVRSKTLKPLLAKLSPNVGNVGEIAKAALRGGADGLVAINTVGPEVYRIDGHPILTSKIGGSLSGPAIKERGLKVVKEIRRAVGSQYLKIVMGGITTARDIEEYRDAAGNDEVLIGIGTATAGMSTKAMARYFPALLYDLEHGTNTAEQYLVHNKSGHKRFGVRQNHRLADGLHVITLDGGFGIEPGQFAFAWIPGVAEKPYSLIENDPATLIVQVREGEDGKPGKLSTALARREKGDVVYLRGPCGNAVELDGVHSAVLVGGGTGIAALYPIQRALRARDARTTSFLGARDNDHLFYAKKFKDNGYTFLATDDGSLGFHGTVTEYLESTAGALEFDDSVFFNCGPRPMVERAEEIEREYASSKRESIYSAVEELTRCGYGLCGECAREDGLRNCVDGPFMHPLDD